MNTQRGVYTGSKIPQKLKKLIKTTVENKGYLNESEFVRNAIKEKLERELDLQRVRDSNGQLASGL